MTTTRNEPSLSRRRPGPKPRGRTVIPLTITVTPEQRAALEVRSDTEKRSISEIVRRFIAAGLATGASLITLSPLIAIITARRGCALKRPARGARYGG